MGSVPNCRVNNKSMGTAYEDSPLTPQLLALRELPPGSRLLQLHRSSNRAGRTSDSLVAYGRNQVINLALACHRHQQQPAGVLPFEVYTAKTTEPRHSDRLRRAVAECHRKGIDGLVVTEQSRFLRNGDSKHLWPEQYEVDWLLEVTHGLLLVVAEPVDLDSAASVNKKYGRDTSECDRRTAALLLLQAGATVDHVANVLGMHLRTVRGIRDTGDTINKAKRQLGRVEVAYLRTGYTNAKQLCDWMDRYGGGPSYRTVARCLKQIKNEW